MELTPVEAELADAVAAGVQLNLSQRPHRVVRAEMIRHLLLGDGVDPHGLKLHGAFVDGALDLSELEVDVPIELTNCAFDEPVALFRSKIPSVMLDWSALPGLDAEGLRTNHFVMRSTYCEGKVRLDGARIEGAADFSAATIRSLDATYLRVGRDIIFNAGFRAESDDELGTLRFGECDLGGALVLTGSTVINRGGGEFGALVLVGAKIGSLLNLEGTTLRSDGAPALLGDRCSTGGPMLLVDGFVAESASTIGTIRLPDAQINGGLSVRGATIRNTAGSAVFASRMRVDASLNIEDGVTVEAATERPALDLSDIDVRSQLAVRQTTITNSGTGLDLSLARSKVGRSLVLPTNQGFVLSLNGLTYPEPPTDSGVDEWLTLLTEQVPAYEPQPYQQLAAVHRAAGHERDARRILIAQQNDQLRRGGLGWRARTLRVISRGVLGYGYQPSRAVAGLIATFIAAIALVIAASWTGGTTPAKDRPADSCSLVNRISLAADLAIPLVKLGTPPKCEIASTTRGQWFTAGGWVIQILGWSFATLSVAGFTGLVRKT